MIIKYEQLVAGALIKFGTIKLEDIELLKIMARKKDILCDDRDKLYKLMLTNQIVITDNDISLAKKYDENSPEISELKNIATQEVNNFFDKLDLEYYVLRKIQHKEAVNKDLLSAEFSPIECEIIEELIEKQMLTTTWNDDIPHDDYLEIKLSPKGKAKIFCDDHCEAITDFEDELESKCFNKNLLPEFLLEQDLTDTPTSILTIENFIRFCHKYDRCEFDLDKPNVNFERLKNKGNSFDEEGKTTFLNLISVWDDQHNVIICNPAHIFTQIKYDENKHITSVDWNLIDIKNMKEKNDYKTFIELDTENSFKYIHSRLSHDIMKKLITEDEDLVTSYLTVIEEYKVNSKPKYLVRGIIRGDNEGYSIAFSPIYKKAIPKSVWEQTRRRCGEHKPALYYYKYAKTKQDN